MNGQLGTKRGVGKTRALVLKWTDRGLKPSEVATKVGISRQAVYQHLTSLRESGELK